MTPTDHPTPPASSPPLSAEERPAFLNFNDWAGLTSYPVFVVGETPKKYRIRSDTRIRLAGRRRALAVGKVALVPKHAITFDRPLGEPPMRTMRHRPTASRVSAACAFGRFSARPSTGQPNE